MVYNQFYDFIKCLNLDSTQHDDLHSGLLFLDIPEMELQVYQTEEDVLLNYYDNLEACDMVYNVSLEQMQNVILDRMGVLL